MRAGQRTAASTSSAVPPATAANTEPSAGAITASDRPLAATCHLLLMNMPFAELGVTWMVKARSDPCRQLPIEPECAENEMRLEIAIYAD
jgi:hypothetical protein